MDKNPGTSARDAIANPLVKDTNSKLADNSRSLCNSNSSGVIGCKTSVHSGDVLFSLLLLCLNMVLAEVQLLAVDGRHLAPLNCAEGLWTRKRPKYSSTAISVEWRLPWRNGFPCASLETRTAMPPRGACCKFLVVAPAMNKLRGTHGPIEPCTGPKGQSQSSYSAPSERRPWCGV